MMSQQAFKFPSGRKLERPDCFGRFRRSVDINVENKRNDLHALELELLRFERPLRTRSIASEPDH